MSRLGGSTIPNGVRFKVRTEHPENNKSDTQSVIIATIKGQEFTAIKSVSSDDMYHKGLQKNFKNLVDIGVLFEGLADLLNAYADTDRFNANGYDKIIQAYLPYIDKRMKYDVLCRRLYDAIDTEVWE